MLSSSPEVTYYFHSGIAKTLQSTYPEFTWHAWLFDHLPIGFWTDQQKVREYVSWLAEHKQLHTFDDYYHLKREDFIDTGGRNLLVNLCRGSILDVLRLAFPEHNWRPWLLSRVPDGYWDIPFHQRQYFEWLADELNIETQEQWYNLKLHEVKAKTGTGHLVQLHYDEYFQKAITSVLIEYTWYEWKFQRVSDNFWESKDNQRSFLDWYAGIHNFQSQEDWYSVSGNSISKFGGSGLLLEYSNSLAKALESVYSEFMWDSWKFGNNPHGLWSTLSSQRRFMDYISENLGMRTFEDWYQVNTLEFRKLGGYGILSVYGMSLCKALCAIYPEYSWQPWFFSSVPHRWWHDFENVRTYIKWLEEKLNISSVEQWYGVTSHQIYNLGGFSMIYYYRGLAPVLRKIYPEYQWESQIFSDKLSHTGGKAHLTLLRVLGEIWKLDVSKSTVATAVRRRLHSKSQLALDEQ